MSEKRQLGRHLVIAVCLCAALAGCHSLPQRPIQPCPEGLPHELDMTSLPDYRLAPTDVINIAAVRLIPKPQAKLEPLDSVVVTFPAFPNLLPDDVVEALQIRNRTLGDVFQIDPAGNVGLGGYGPVKIGGMSLQEAQEAIAKVIKGHPKEGVKAEIVDKGGVKVEFAEPRALQAIDGDHLVRPEGTINLGIYGNIWVCGLTEKEAKEKIEQALAEYYEKAEVLVQIAGFNSRAFYVIIEQPGAGEQIAKFPVTGNDKVMDVVSQLGGFPGVASKSRIWIARPAPGGQDQILPVYWRDITRRGRVETNYQLMAGDRLFLAATPMGIFNYYLNVVLQPAERIFQAILFGQAVVQSIRFGTGFFGGGLFNPFFPVIPPQ